MTDIPDDIMKTAERLWGGSVLDIARAIMAERNKALGVAAAAAMEEAKAWSVYREYWRERDACRQVAGFILALKHGEPTDE